MTTRRADAGNDPEESMKRTSDSIAATGSLGASYLLELRRLISEDAYRTLYVADEIARRLLRSGDL